MADSGLAAERSEPGKPAQIAGSDCDSNKSLDWDSGAVVGDIATVGVGTGLCLIFKRPLGVSSCSSSDFMPIVRSDIIDPEVLDDLKHYYKHSQGYKEHLAVKTEAYFAGYVGVMSSVTEPSSLILDLGCGTGTSTKYIAARDRRVIGCDIYPPFLCALRLSLLLTKSFE